MLLLFGEGETTGGDRPLTEGEAKAKGLGEQRAKLAMRQGQQAMEKIRSTEGDYGNVTLKELRTAAWYIWITTKDVPDSEQKRNYGELEGKLQQELAQRYKELEDKTSKGESVDQLSRKEVRLGEWAQWD